MVTVLCVFNVRVTCVNIPCSNMRFYVVFHVRPIKERLTQPILT